jgi:hypothetical protein
MSSIVSRLRRVLLKQLEKPRRGYEQRVYNDADKLYGAIRPGDVLLVEGRSEMSRIIKLFSGSYWSHAAMYVGSALTALGDDRAKWYIEKYGPDANHLLIEAY